MDSEMKVSLRPTRTEDFEFLWTLHNLALKNYVAEVWGWDEDWQRKLFRRTFNPASGQIIVIEGKDAGFLEVLDKQTETLLVSIRILPIYQNKGVGTRLIQNIITAARKNNHPVRLQVLKINPARRLYERLGFRIFEQTETHFWMRLE